MGSIGTFAAGSRAQAFKDRASFFLWDQLRGEALLTLQLDEEPLRGVLPVLNELIGALRIKEERQVELFQMVKVSSDTPESADLLERFRTARDEAQANIDRLRSDLRNLLATRQEAALVGLGILR